MTNHILCVTSCVMLLSHTQSLHASTPTPLVISYVLGPLTSIWNHGTTSTWAKWTDRITMTAGFLLDLHYCHSSTILLLLFTSILAYLYAKHTHIAWHVLAHACVCLAHHKLANSAQDI